MITCLSHLKTSFKQRMEYCLCKGLDHPRHGIFQRVQICSCKQRETLSQAWFQHPLDQSTWVGALGGYENISAWIWCRTMWLLFLQLSELFIFSIYGLIGSSLYLSHDRYLQRGSKGGSTSALCSGSWWIRKPWMTMTWSTCFSENKKWAIPSIV